MDKIINFNDFFLKESAEVKNLEKKLLSMGGSIVKPGLDTEEELMRIINDGILFSVNVVNLKGDPNQCHRNVASKYKKFSSNGFKIVSGYALSNETWFQHSWGLGHTGKIMETTGNKYDKYYGYVLSDHESDEFCSDNW